MISDYKRTRERTMVSQEQTTIKQGIIAAIPTVIGYWSVGFAAGVLSYIAGLSVLETALLSAFLYAGSGQFIFVQMVISNASPFTFYTTMFFVHLRYILMSLYLSQKFQPLPWWKAFIIGNYITDETFGVASVQAKKQNHLTFPWMFALNTTSYVNWFLGNVVGAFFGSFIPNAYIEPLQFSLVAMFLGLVAQQIDSTHQRAIHFVVALLSIVLVILLTPFIDRHISLICASLLTATAGLLILRYQQRGEK